MMSRTATAVTGVAVLFAVICIWTAPVARPDNGQSLADQALVETLRRGGYNIYFRHAATDWSTDDHVVAEGDWQSCDARRMRQLSDQGRKQAERIGRAMRRLEIPVGAVFSSEYCRTRETARHMDLGPVEPRRAIMNMRAAAFVGGRDALVERARQFLSMAPPERTNAVIVAHGNLLRATSGAYTGEAGAVVMAPQGDGRFRIVAEIDPQRWEALAREFGPPIPGERRPPAPD